MENVVIARDTAGSADVIVPPLTRNGYTRTERVERQIASLLNVGEASLATAFDAAEDEGGNATEALVFFVRREVARANRRSAEALFAKLVARCQQRLRGAIRGMDGEARGEIQAEVLADLTRLILADDDRGDFLQVRFWLYLRRRVATARGNWLRFVAQTSPVLPSELDMGAACEPAPLASNAPSPEDFATVGDALERLPPDLRELVVLRFYEEWRVGDEPAESRIYGDPTLAERFRITPRAVRKRLKKAANLMSQDLEDAL